MGVIETCANTDDARIALWKVLVTALPNTFGVHMTVGCSGNEADANKYADGILPASIQVSSK